MRISQIIVTGAAALALAACSTTPTAFGGNIAIQSPANNSAVNAPVDLKVAVNFSTNFTLREPGACGSESGCGHVLLYIDSSDCNAPSHDYNALAVTSPTDVAFAYCATPIGAHRITAELHDDGGAVVTHVGGDPVQSTVNITLQP